MNDMSEHLLKCYMYSSKVFARSAIHWIPEVLSARHAFVTEIGPARLTEYKTMSTLNLQPILCENAFLFVLFLSRWDFVRSVKAVRNISQSTFAAVAQNTLRAPRGK